MNSPLNIGILAHADAGKTTLTEQILFKKNAIKTPGFVDKGSSVSDSLEVEKFRGISVQNSSLSFTINGKNINLIDTPGHVDFSSELDRIFSILDVAIVVISAVEGIQGQTIRIMECLKERKIPTVIFINKIDRIGSDVEDVYNSITKEFKIGSFILNDQENFRELYNNSLESLSNIQDDFLEMYLEDKLPSGSDILNRVLKESSTLDLFPTFIGSAKNDIGVSELLDYIQKIDTSNHALKGNSLLVFKINYSEKKGIQFHVKNFGQPISPKTKIKYEGEDILINEISKQLSHKSIRVESLGFNDIGIITLSKPVSLGKFLGEYPFDSSENQYSSLSQDALKVEISEELDSDYIALSNALEILNIENPDLNLYWNRKAKTFQISIQGEIQIEILQEILLNRFNIETLTKPIEIQYKETPKSKAEGYVRYWMPKPCWAIMTFLIEPGEKNSGIQYKSKVGVNDISQKYQNEIERAIPKSLKQGIKGWPVTDIKITLIKGEEHQVHSNPGDFLLATPMGILRGIENSETDLLEPYYEIQMKFNSDLLGDVHTQLNKIGGIIGESKFEDDQVILDCVAPVAKSLKFPIVFNSITSGKGRLLLNIDSYRKTESDSDKHKEYQGVNPLDEAQWILHNRGAYKADERNR